MDVAKALLVLSELRLEIISIVSELNKIVRLIAPSRSNIIFQTFNRPAVGEEVKSNKIPQNTSNPEHKQKKNVKDNKLSISEGSPYYNKNRNDCKLNSLDIEESKHHISGKKLAVILFRKIYFRTYEILEIII